ncbi:MAG: YcxB family protein [Coriobacteriales bacterium]|nr:YcxB family protein [Coriobacteriales bacterium]
MIAVAWIVLGSIQKNTSVTSTGWTFGLLVVFIILAPYFQRRRIKLLYRRSGYTKLIQTLHFKEHIEVSNANTITMYSYDQIRYIDEDKFGYYLYIDVIRGSLVAKKDTFILGDKDDFATFINSKCCETGKLLTKAELSKKIIKRYWLFLLVLLMISLSFISFAIPFPTTLNTRNVNDYAIAVLSSARFGDTEIVATLQYESASIVFGTDGKDDIFALSLNELTPTGYRYYWSSTYSISEMVKHNRESQNRFESNKEELVIEAGRQEIIFGVADASWWLENAPDTQKQSYTVVLVYCNGQDYALYYRLANR